MKIFSLFSKKQQTQADTPVEDARDSGNGMRADSQGERSGNGHSDRRSAARATELKIDAIESAMSLQLDAELRPNPTPAPGTVRARGQADTEAGRFSNTVPRMDASTEILFDDGLPNDAIALATTLPTPIVEEAAILFANGQQALAEQLLENAILHAAPSAHDQHAHLLLFDLYQLSGQQQAFDNLSTGYISRFETSPPAWRDSAQLVPSAAPASSQPSVVFAAVLDGDSAQQIAHAQLLSAAHRVLQLDLSRIRKTDPDGCALLLQLLLRLHKSGHDLVLPGAPELVEYLQSTLQAGRSDASAAPWLLLLELLRLLNREQEFEESSIEYCIAFEISPPAFEAPKPPSTLVPLAGQGGVLSRYAPFALVSSGQTAAAGQPERFAMPDLVAGDTRQLIDAIVAFAAERETVVIDCSQLNRIDFTASGQLLTGLVPLAGNGKMIEFHDVNHPVAALLNVMGLKEIARIIPHKG